MRNLEAPLETIVGDAATMRPVSLESLNVFGSHDLTRMDRLDRGPDRIVSVSRASVAG